MSKSNRPRRRAEPRRYRGHFRRNVATREPLGRFLIVCEGEKTEPNYFRAFRVPGLIIDVHGTGHNTVKLVEEAIERRGRNEFDYTWCVLDRDAFPTANFNAALQLAEKHGIKVAYSNQAFELWYRLHFDYYHVATRGSDYLRQLTRLLGHPYEKNSETIYEELVSRQPAAIRNAAMLLAQYDPPNPADDNPSTTVHLLVIELKRHVR